jgi:hypothetical protein
MVQEYLKYGNLLFLSLRIYSLCVVGTGSSND